MITTLAFFIYKKLLKETLTSQKWGKKKWLQLPDFHTYVIFSTLPRILDDNERFVLHN
jgi:hypothetical protein